MTMGLPTPRLFGRTPGDTKGLHGPRGRKRDSRRSGNSIDRVPQGARVDASPGRSADDQSKADEGR